MDGRPAPAVFVVNGLVENVWELAERQMVRWLTLTLHPLVSVIPSASAPTGPKGSPRGTKRSRSPEQSGDLGFAGGADDGTCSEGGSSLAAPVRHAPSR